MWVWVLRNKYDLRPRGSPPGGLEAPIISALIVPPPHTEYPEAPRLPASDSRSDDFDRLLARNDWHFLVIPAQKMSVTFWLERVQLGALHKFCKCMTFEGNWSILAFISDYNGTYYQIEAKGISRRGPLGFTKSSGFSGRNHSAEALRRESIGLQFKVSQGVKRYLRTLHMICAITGNYRHQS